MGLITAFLILSFYSVVAGWTLAYMVRALGGVFDGQSAQAIGAAFDSFLGNPEALLAWHTIFMLLTPWSLPAAWRAAWSGPWSG